MKEDKHRHRRGVSDGQGASYEMQPQRLRRPGIPHQRSVSGNDVNDFSRNEQSTSSGVRRYESGFDMQRNNSTGRRVGEGLKKRFGSLRLGKKTTEV